MAKQIINRQAMTFYSSKELNKYHKDTIKRLKREGQFHTDLGWKIRVSSNTTSLVSEYMDMDGNIQQYNIVI